MKAIFFSLALLVGPAVWAQVSPPMPLPNSSKELSFEARSIANGGAVNTAQSSSGGIYNTSTATRQTHRNGITIEIQARNFGKVPAQAHFEWYFVAKAPHKTGHSGQQNRSPFFVWDKGEKDLPVVAGGSQTTQCESKPLELVEQGSIQSQATSVYVTGQVAEARVTTSHSLSGALPYGWIVRMMDGTQVLQARVSSSELEGFLHDPGQMAELLQGVAETILPATPKPLATPGLRR